MTKPPHCYRCQSLMTRGFGLQHKNSIAEVASWVAGEPEKSWWAAVRLRGRKPVAVVAYRCNRCGLLEHYAPE